MLPQSSAVNSARSPTFSPRLFGNLMRRTVYAGDVVTLTDDNFDQQLAAHSTDPWFIAIGAPWCPREHWADGAFAAALKRVHTMS